MNRKALVNIPISLTVIGLGFVGYMFLSGLSITDKQKNSAWATCDLTEMHEGTIRECGYGNVYKRTELDKESVSKYTHLLADPDQNESTQPDSAKNKWRSENKDFFVYYPWTPNTNRRCGIHFKKAGTYIDSSWGIPEYEAIKNLPYFIDYCESRTWDVSGRLYNRNNYPPEYNLIVPNIKWASHTKLYVHTP